MNNNASHLSTPLPCPPWCVLPAGHGFESLTDEGLLRVYEGQYRGVLGCSVLVLSEETARADAGPVLLSVTRVAVETGERAFTGPEARQLAAALLNAADEWDRVTGAQAPRRQGKARLCPDCLRLRPVDEASEVICCGGTGSTS